MPLTPNLPVIPAQYLAYFAVFVTRFNWSIRLVLIILTMVIGDMLVFSWRPNAIPQLYWMLLDSPVHTLLAVLVVSPLFAHPCFRQQKFGWIVITGLVTVSLDLDHMVAARSFSLYDIQHLSVRPISHSLLFAISCSFVACLVTRRATVGWLVFGALTSHVVRDASSGSTLFLWPLLKLDTLPVPVHYISQIGLYLLMSSLVGGWFTRDGLFSRPFRRRPPGNLIDQPDPYGLD